MHGDLRRVGSEPQPTKPQVGSHDAV